jgi:polyphosphate kinase
VPPEENKDQEPGAIGLDDPKLYINRELSWLQFNRRVLEEALDTRHPLLERVKFLSIFASNLDEFYMIRVSGLRRQLAALAVDAPPDGTSPAEQLHAIRQAASPLLECQWNCWHHDLLPKLEAEGIHILRYQQLKSKQRKLLRKHFEHQIFPVLTPLALDPTHPFPHISNLSMNLAVALDDPRYGERFARIKVPPVFPRLLRIPGEEMADNYESLGLSPPYTSLRSGIPERGPFKETASHYTWLEEVIAANLDLLFPGMEIHAAYPFRVTRDADPEIEEDEASDLLPAIQESVRKRFFGHAVRLEVDDAMPEQVRNILIRNLGLAPFQIYTSQGPMAMADLMQLTKIDRPDLKDVPFQPATPPVLTIGESIFSILKQRDIVLYHPYDSFAPVVHFLQEAVEDPDVLAIKQTLYRVGPNSPIVAALMKARENRKQVAVLVELKARFDEENNIGWARALEQAGVHVVYGLVRLKVHAKLLLVVRREGDGIRRYVHMSTGNYNDVTARLYSDVGFLTSDPSLGADVSDLFNVLTGYSYKQSYRKLLVAPDLMKGQILARIEREIEEHRQQGNGYLAFKMNALVDTKCIQALYRASQAGVKVDLQVRGMCCLRPGVPGISDNITVTSIVGRFLEHPRMYYFRNGGDEELLLGSADLMPRNLDRRVEQLFPIEDPDLRESLYEHVLRVHLQDNMQARRLLPNGEYERIHPGEGEPELNSQLWMIEHRGLWSQD